MTMDVSASWEGASERFMANQSHIGAASVSARGNDRLPLSSGILDIGWSSGTPIVRALVDSGFSIWGIDASPSLLSAYRRALPNMPAVFEPVLHSSFFGRTFVGIVSIGLIFLLDGKGQRMLLARVADILEPGGRFLFTASRQARRWNDTLTGRLSLWLGDDAYAAHLASVGLGFSTYGLDQGGNNHFEAIKPT